VHKAGSDRAVLPGFSATTNHPEGRHSLTTRDSHRLDRPVTDQPSASWFDLFVARKRIAREIRCGEHPEIFGTLMQYAQPSTVPVEDRTRRPVNARDDLVQINRHRVAAPRCLGLFARALNNEISSCVETLNVQAVTCMDPILVDQTQRFEAFVCVIKNCAASLVLI
jgi:hypothetical protein